MRKLLFIFILLFLPGFSWAAVLYLEPESGGYYQGDTFIVTTRIDTEGECINTVQADLKFPQDVFNAVDFSQGGSILNFWVTAPLIDNNQGLISFSGGAPGGYCGRIPGDPGESNILGKIIFKVKENNGQKIFTEVRFLETSKVLLNDGLGTQAVLSSKKAVFTILPGLGQAPKREWQRALEEDKTLPEPFIIEISKDPNLFAGKYFVIFSTLDRQTGLDHYEVKEGDKEWQRAESPYLLKDQHLKSSVLVKAVDKAGNERTIEYVPIKQPQSHWIILSAIIIGGIILFIVFKKRRAGYVRKNLPLNY